MKVRTILEKIAVEPLMELKTTESGMKVTGTSFYKDNIRGKVISVGDGKPDEPMQVEVGDVVWFSKHVGTKLNIERDLSKPKKEVIIIQQREVVFIDDEQ